MRLPKVPVKFALLGAGAAAAIGIAFATWSWTANASRSSASAAEPIVRPARVMTVAYHQPTKSLMLAGTVVPRIESTLGFRVAGKIVQREVDVGAVVQRGQVIARLDPADYQLAVDNARAALAAAEADYMKAKGDHDRYTALRNTSVFMPQTLEARQAAATTARGRVDQARSQLASAENNLAYTELRADGAGIVTAVQAEVGQVMAQGQGVARVARTEELEILVGVPEHRLSLVRGAELATFELWSDSGRRHVAKLRELSPSADPTTRTYAARFSIVDPPEFIGLGMTASLTVSKPGDEHVAEVPLAAIFQRGTQPAVWVVDPASGSVSLRPVTIARFRNDSALIASGVVDGEIVATAGVHKLEVGQKVRPVQQAQR
jgi:RND family efflux transporter MFP subunit